MFFIIGASGVGKSVLIKHLVGLLYPDTGEILLDGEEVSQFDEKRDGPGPQEVRDGVPALDALRLDDLRRERRPPPPQAPEASARRRRSPRRAERLEVVHMQEFGDRYPPELGDGMRKRVAIARALTLDPRYVLFDEPTTSLDPVSARRVDKLIRELADKLGVTCVVVCHDLTSIFSIADRIVMLYRGKVRLLGTPDDFRSTDDASSSSSSTDARRARSRRDVRRHARSVLQVNGGAREGAIDRGQGRRPHPRGPRAPRRVRPDHGQVAFSPSSPSYVDFDNPGGLQSGVAGARRRREGRQDRRDSVPRRRAKPGRPKNASRWCASKMSVEKRVQQAIHDNSIFYVTTQGVLGEQFLAIDPGSRRRPVLPEGRIVHGLDPPRLDMLLAEGFELLAHRRDGLRDNRQQIAETFEGLHDTLRGTGEFFKTQPGPTSTTSPKAAERLTADADELVKRYADAYVDNPQVARILDRIDNDRDRLRATPSRCSRTRARRWPTSSAITKGVAGPEQQAKIKAAIDDIAEIASRAKATAADAQAIVSHIRQGQGTVGALVMDEQLYDDIQELARDLKHNPWKFFWRE